LHKGAERFLEMFIEEEIREMLELEGKALRNIKSVFEIQNDEDDVDDEENCNKILDI
jgi:hypothetical protein